MSDRFEWRPPGRDSMNGVRLFSHRYLQYPRESSTKNCSFCWARFMVDVYQNVMHDGQVISDDYGWVCTDCFADFKAISQWRALKTAGKFDETDI